jgi:hypothetical protein
MQNREDFPKHKTVDEVVKEESHQFDDIFKLLHLNRIINKTERQVTS